MNKLSADWCNFGRWFSLSEARIRAALIDMRSTLAKTTPFLPRRYPQPQVSISCRPLSRQPAMADLFFGTLVKKNIQAQVRADMSPFRDQFGSNRRKGKTWRIMASRRYQTWGRIDGCRRL